MKLIKKITAATTALVMAVGMMSMGASADNASVYLHYNKYAPTSDTVVSKSENVRVSSMEQRITVRNFNKPTGSSASVTVHNDISPILTKTFDNDGSLSYIINDTTVLGRYYNVGASLNNYVSAASVSVTCDFKC